MGVDDLIWGRLTDVMQIEEGQEIDLTKYVHPRAEPEIAFLLNQPWSGKVTKEEALAAVEAIAPEVIAPEVLKPNQTISANVINLAVNLR